MGKLPTSFGEKDTNFINEAGLFNLVFRSNKPNAKEFANFVCSEVLPSIRKNGFYFAPNSAFASLQNLLNPKTEPLTLEQFDAFQVELKNTTQAVIHESLKNIPVTLSAMELIERKPFSQFKPSSTVKMVGKEKKLWTEEEYQVIRTMREQGYTTREISQELGPLFSPHSFGLAC